MRELENAAIRLLREYPFYGQFLLGFRRETSSLPHPLGVTIRDGVPVLTVNPPLFADVTAPDQLWLLRHCIAHVLLLHPIRGKGKERSRWNLAADMAVNSLIGAPEWGAQPADAGLDAGLSAEEYYTLLQRLPDFGSMEGDGAGDAGRSTAGRSDCRESGDAKEGAVDSHAAWDEAASTPETLAEQVVRQMTAAALRTATDVPPELRRRIDGLLTPPSIPWREVLRQFTATAGRTGRSSTWMRTHRRFEHQTPGNRKRRRLNLLVGIDVSESTDRHHLREAFAQELLRIARGADASITVLYANSRIRRIESLKGSPLAVEAFHGGGFTDLRPVFEYGRRMVPPPAAVIYLTDGFGPAPDAMEFPTLWVLTPEGKKPVSWGVELRLQEGKDLS